MADRHQELGEKGPPAWEERGRHDIPDEPPDSSGEVDQLEGQAVDDEVPADAGEDPDETQQQLARTGRDTGGDAEAAGSIEQREAVARDEDETWPAS